MLYMTLPVTIGLFTWRHDWTGTGKRISADPAAAELRP